ncbi:putative signal transducing protein [Pseudomonas oryzihabitans]|uniref:putative signal transducing protein n=1 Tax=Pseudomonas oryzihabitans TaxID=47885 RepID=UPI003F97376C
MRRIYEPGSLHEGELLLAVLASEGISGFLAGRHLLGGIGDLPVAGLLGLLVEDEEALRAQALIAAYNAATPLPGEDPSPEQGILVC